MWWTEGFNQRELNYKMLCMCFSAFFFNRICCFFHRQNKLIMLMLLCYVGQSECLEINMVDYWRKQKMDTNTLSPICMLILRLIDSGSMRPLQGPCSPTVLCTSDSEAPPYSKLQGTITDWEAPLIVENILLETSKPSDHWSTTNFLWVQHRDLWKKYLKIKIQKCHHTHHFIWNL